MSGEYTEDELRYTSSDGIAVHTRERNQLKDKSMEEFRYEYRFKRQE